MTQIKEPVLSCILAFSKVRFKRFNKTPAISGGGEKRSIFSSDQQLRDWALEHQSLYNLFCLLDFKQL